MQKLFRAVSDEKFEPHGAKYPIHRAGVAYYDYRSAQSEMERLRGIHGGDWHIEKTIKTPGIGVGSRWVKS